MLLSELPSPALVLDAKAIERNIDLMIRIAGSADRLRPHCKTHKMREVIALELTRGITKHKCATLAEAEMLAECGVRDILLAYNVVGPNIARVVRLLDSYPDLRFACTGDHLGPLHQLSAALVDLGQEVEVLLDLDVGMHRTGILPGDEAIEIYRTIAQLPALKPGGLHAYDGHNHQPELNERRTAAMQVWNIASRFRDELVAMDLPVPRIVCGGTPTFPIFAELTDPVVELSPGTVVLHDSGYGRAYPDMPFEPAARMLTRVISRPAPYRLTLDLGHKAVAGDPPAGKRVTFPDLPDAVAVMHSEEHLVIETPLAENYQPGDSIFAIPTHICPTCALHKEAYVIEGNNVVATWQVASRNRV